MLKFSVADVARATGGNVWPSESDGIVSAVVTDSRATGPGSLFIALRGKRFDGHDFIADAIQAGAAAVMIEKSAHSRVQAVLRTTDTSAVLVDDTLHALQSLAGWYRSRFTVPVVGVTGSNGKTTTKDLIAAVLGTRFPVHATHANLNNEIGVPLTVLQMDRKHRGLVVEMGMRARGEIRQLAQIVRPTIGVVTNVGPVHVEFLGNLAGVAAAKAELVEQLPAHGVAVLNGDDPYVAAMAAQTDAQVVTFGLNPNVDVQAYDVVSLGFEGMAFRVRTPLGELNVRTSLLGEHNVYNALATIAAAQACGLTSKEIEAGLANVRLSGMRLEVIKLSGDIAIVNDAYNASPASMRAALQTLRQLPGKRKAAVLGDMLELGELAQREHEAIGRQAVASGVNRLIVVGRWAEAVAAAARSAGMSADAIMCCDDADDAARAVAAWMSEHDVILVKASRGLQLERVVDFLVQQRGACSASAVGSEPEGAGTA